MADHILWVALGRGGDSWSPKRTKWGVGQLEAWRLSGGGGGGDEAPESLSL